MKEACNVVIIFGPTAVGKTALIENRFKDGFEIINADSMQVYKHLDIGTAKPGREILEKIPHHLIDIKDPREQYTVGEFVRKADMVVEDIIKRGKIPVVSGGTAFYIRAFLFGLPAAPPANQEIRFQLKTELEKKGAAALYKQLQSVDPVTAERIGENDEYRITRALEVYRTAGTPLSLYDVPLSIREGLRPLVIGLMRERSELYCRIDARVEEMFRSGLTDEIKYLVRQGYNEEDPGMAGIGYREFFFMRRAGCPTTIAVRELIKRNTRRFAKRQLTFFRKIPQVHWIYPSHFSSVDRLVRQFIG